MVMNTYKIMLKTLMSYRDFSDVVCHYKVTSRTPQNYIALKYQTHQTTQTVAKVVVPRDGTFDLKIIQC